ALEGDALRLHLDLGPEPPPSGDSCEAPASFQCPFCIELEGETPSVFKEMMGDRLASRIVYEDDDFVLMPPLGEFMAGGLLLLTRKHIPSFALLPQALFGKLEALVDAVRRALVARWVVPPLIFEHGPAAERTKGQCCVDHAHFNIFPAPVVVHPHLRSRMSSQIVPLQELSMLERAEFGYLFVQENDGTRRVYDGHCAPTQLVRRVVTSELGMPERWHWRDFPGCDELVETYKALKGRITP
ncbi:MAG: HIT family protein, partial [Limisphaerales bacterium]